MSGLIDTGLTYKKTALSGMVRESAEQQRIDEENKQLKAQADSQKKTMVAEGAAVGAVAGMQSGSVGGPYGALIGAAAGFLFSELF